MADEVEIKKLLADDNALKAIAEAAFKKVDTDNSGFIDRNELKALMDEASQGNFPSVTEAELDEIYKGLDTNNDGKISVDEFSVLIRAVLESMLSS